MAIEWSFARDKTEQATPRTVDDCTPIEGGIMRRFDTDDNMYQYCWYLLVRAGSTGGTYTGRWQVLSPNRTADQTAEEMFSEAIPANNTDLILLPPISASSDDVLVIGMGNVPDPSDAQLQNQVSGWAGNVQSRFSPKVTGAVFNSDVNNSPMDVRQPPTT